MLKIPHHGSASSTNADLLAVVHPKFAVISVGARNVYHHPRTQVLERLQHAGAVTYRTDINGARISRIRTFVKQVEAALDAGNKEQAAAALLKVQPELARGVAKGVFHKNTASRKMSRLSKRLAALG